MMRAPFVLILSCTGGAGHLRAAEALHRTASTLGIPLRTENIDVLDLTSRVFKRLYSESYLQMVNRAPELWGYLYQRSEQIPYTKKGLVRLFDELNYRKYVGELRRLNPDAILCTHFLPYISVGERLRSHGINAPVFVSTTDFDVHQLWIHPIVRRYFVFHEETAWQLESKGVPPERITVTGIPVNPEFVRREPASKVRRRLGLASSATTLLLLSGGFGTGRLSEIAAAVLRATALNPDTSFTLLVVCGRNEGARKEITSIRPSANVSVKVFGFVSNIHELMDASDILISKSGGLTSSESLAKGLPMIIVDPIPGQEARNADMIVEHGAGWKAVNAANIEYKLRMLLASPELLAKASVASLTLAKPHAARDILVNVVRTIRGKTK